MVVLSLSSLSATGIMWIVSTKYRYPGSTLDHLVKVLEQSAGFICLSSPGDMDVLTALCILPMSLVNSGGHSWGTNGLG